MLQKIVNGIAIVSGVVSPPLLVCGYVFIRKDAIIENVKAKVMESVLPSGLGAGILFLTWRVHKHQQIQYHLV